MSDLQGVSVVICCYNSASKLPETLQYLSLQKVPDDFKWEIIIVDNACTDATVEVAIEKWSAYSNNIPLRIATQPISGLSYAREKGIEEAFYDLILFCDDDNHLDQNYLRTAYEIMEKNADVCILGGNVIGKFEGGVCDPMIEPFLSALAIGAQSKKSGYTEKPLFGAGMVLRKASYIEIKKAGFRSLLTDRKAGYLSSGGDTELCLAFLIGGYKLYYDERLQMEHFMPKSRLNMKYIGQLCSNGIPSFILLNLYTCLYHRPDNSYSYNKVYFSIVTELLNKMFYYLPRTILGSYQYYSRFSLKQNLNALLHVLANYKNLKESFEEIRSYTLKFRTN